MAPAWHLLSGLILPAGSAVNVNVAANAGSVVYHSSTYAATAAKQTVINIPTVVASSVLGPAVQSPATQYLAIPTQALPQLTTSQKSNSVINADLAVNFNIWNGSGTIPVSFLTTLLW